MDKKNIPLVIHPRILSAIGEDLITNDIVAINELVKNSYDALAKNVRISIDDKRSVLVVKDDGIGMSRSTIENVWAKLGTPNKKDNPFISGRGIERVVTGNKGLGRFASARLSKVLTLITKSENEGCYKAVFKWEDFYNQENFQNCTFSIEEIQTPLEILNNEYKTGTILKLSELTSDWNDEELLNLSNELKRFDSPFKQIKDFKIFLNTPITSEEVIVKSHEFLDNPQHKILGYVDNDGTITYEYTFIDYKNSDNKFNLKKKIETGEIKLEEYNKSFTEKISNAQCGSFTFEIRSWERSSDELEKINVLFDNDLNLRTNEIKRIIRENRGVSLYRDNVLVMPKASGNDDWLNLAARRMDRVGDKLATNQLVGAIDISKENNPKLNDATNREVLVINDEFQRFKKIIVEGIINKLEKLRKEHNTENSQKQSSYDLFGNIKPKRIIDNLKTSIEQGTDLKTAMKAAEDEAIDQEKNIEELKKRVEYQGQLATVGQLSEMLIHEIRGNCNLIEDFNLSVVEEYKVLSDNLLLSYNNSEKARKTLLDLSDIFGQLGKRNFKNRKYSTNLYEEVEKTINLLIINKKNINIKILNNIHKDYITTMSPTEISVIIYNLVDNAFYWLGVNKVIDPIIQIDSELDYENKRINVYVNDNGLGIEDGREYKIFEPGITSKLQGFGMGLVLCSEFISFRGGNIYVVKPSVLGGATFKFDIPLV